ncbi:unnamed protein product [Euphydryas editha]|nr:unnamed protein product [Euphydryas editha]
MLMYLFDQKCVLFPKLLSLTSIRQNIIYEFIPEDKEVADMLPVDFLSTQWVEKSACLLPTYVPLVSGIFGLVWTTMVLMCSTGSRVLTGLQRPWRVLPPVFLFSVIMGILCVYTSTVTHYGLQELCLKLSEITGSSTCTYTINVATLAYERRIRGVYQATRLTILSAWLHTACWVLSALLALMRVILAVDFQLVKVTVQLRGNIDRMLERHEKHIRTVSPEILEENRPYTSVRHPRSLIQLHFKKKIRDSLLGNNEQNIIKNADDNGNLLYYSGLTEETSELSLVQIEREKLDKMSAYRAVAKKHRFIIKMLLDLIDNVDRSQSTAIISSSSSLESISESAPIIRQYGQQRISSRLIHKSPAQYQEIESEDLLEAEEISLEIKHHLQMKLNRQLSELNAINYTSANTTLKSSMNITPEMRKVLEDKKGAKFELTLSDPNEPGTHRGKKKTEIKSNLKQVGIQTDEKMKDKSLKVKIDSHTSVIDLETSTILDNQTTKENKETQTKKEKQE